MWLLAKRQRIVIYSIANSRNTWLHYQFQVNGTHYCSLERNKLSALQTNNGKWDRPAHLSPLAAEDLKWWLQNIPGAVTPIHHGNPTCTLFTDSSSYAWGGWLEGKICQDFFSPAEYLLSINTKETLAIYYSILSFKNKPSNCHFLIQSENTSACSYIFKFEEMSSELRDKIAKDIWELVVDMNSWLLISHITGVDNCSANGTSHIINICLEETCSASAF